MKKMRQNKNTPITLKLDLKNSEVKLGFFDKKSKKFTLGVRNYFCKGFIMSMFHSELAIEGLQFHPESYMTAYGKRMLGNWIGLVCDTQYKNFL